MDFILTLKPKLIELILFYRITTVLKAFFGLLDNICERIVIPYDVFTLLWHITYEGVVIAYNYGLLDISFKGVVISYDIFDLVDVTY